MFHLEVILLDPIVNLAQVWFWLAANVRWVKVSHCFSLWVHEQLWWMHAWMYIWVYEWMHGCMHCIAYCRREGSGGRGCRGVKYGRIDGVWFLNFHSSGRLGYLYSVIMKERVLQWVEISKVQVKGKLKDSILWNWTRCSNLMPVDKLLSHWLVLFSHSLGQFALICCE